MAQTSFLNKSKTDRYGRPPLGILNTITNQLLRQKENTIIHKIIVISYFYLSSYKITNFGSVFSPLEFHAHSQILEVVVIK